MIDILTNGISGSSELELQDQMDRSLSQLRALIHQTFGKGGEAFRELNEELQDNFMFALSDMVDGMVAINRELSKRQQPRRQALAAS